jgi:hypothetical protein
MPETTSFRAASQRAAVMRASNSGLDSGAAHNSALPDRNASSPVDCCIQGIRRYVGQHQQILRAAALGQGTRRHGRAALWRRLGQRDLRFRQKRRLCRGTRDRDSSTGDGWAVGDGGGDEQRPSRNVAPVDRFCTRKASGETG